MVGDAQYVTFAYSGKNSLTKIVIKKGMAYELDLADYCRTI